MDRMACVDLPSFPLQLLLKRQPDWKSRPAAVVDADRPQGRILWTNEQARSSKVLPGMRYAAALALAPDLRAATVSGEEIERAVTGIAGQLRRYTPDVEPGPADRPGLFWLNAAGLERLYPSLVRWAEQIRLELERSGFGATVIAGFSRFGSYAVARHKRGVVVFRAPADERAAAARVPLDRLDLEPAARDALAKLGVVTVGDFVRLPSEGIGGRFGPEAQILHRSASGALCLPLQPARPLPPAMQRLHLDHPEISMDRLMAVVEKLVHPLLRSLAERSQRLAGLHLGFRFERLGDHVERLRPAAPTLDAAQLLELIRLRLEAVRKLPDAVVEVVLVAEGIAAAREQKRLFEEQPRRDLDAANRALARIRAEMGDDAVVHAVPREGHLPEGSFSWEKIDALAAPRALEQDRGRLIRRLYDRPQPLRSRSRHEPDGWMLRGLERGPVIRFQGPYIVAGGWWQRPVQREYHYAETREGDLLWVYYDRPQRRWYLHGRVE
jgi:protein ImuB